MTAEKKKEEVRVVLPQMEKLTTRLDSLHMEISLAISELTNEAAKINDARIRLALAKQRMMKLLGGI